MRPPCPSRHHSRSRGPTAPPIPALGIEAASADVQLLQSRSALPQAKPCGNRVVTTRRQPVVTTREMPQPPWAAHGLQQVTAPSDVLSARPKRRPCNAICPDPLPAGHISWSVSTILTARRQLSWPVEVGGFFSCQGVLDVWSSSSFSMGFLASKVRQAAGVKARSGGQAMHPAGHKR
jgi:hypothetical protein